MDQFINSTTFFFALFNPFLMSIYLLDLIKELKPQRFFWVLFRASLISLVTFTLFAWAGEAIFTSVLFVRFASFQIFGGLIFATIGLRYIFIGAESIKMMRGKAEHLEGSVALPFMIGPGTLSAAVLIGGRHTPTESLGVISLTLATALLTIVGLKFVYDKIKEKKADLVERYIDIVGRISALYIGTVAIEMIVRGVKGWLV